MPAAWRASLRPASFRSVPFLLLTAEGEHGRRFASHEYPLRDEPWHEDLGRKAKVLRLDGFVLEPGHIAKAKALIEAVEKPGPGVLTHPWLGDLTMVVTECRVRFSHAEGGMAAFALGFAEAGESLYPAPVKNAAGVVDRAAATAKSAISGRFLQNFTLDKVAGWVAGSAGGLLKDAFTAMGPIGEGIVSGAGKAAAWAGDLNQALATVTTIVRNPAALAGRVLGLVDLGNLSGITALVQTPLSVRTAIESFTRPGALSLSWKSFLPLSRFSATITALLDDDSYQYAGGGNWEPGPAPNAAGGSYYGGSGGSSTPIPVARRQEAINRAELSAFVRRAATIEMARTAVRQDFATAGDATAAAEAIADAVDRELATAGDEDGQALQALSIATQQALAARVPDLPRALVFRVAAAAAALDAPILDTLGRRFGYVPGATLPAIVIAQAVYGDTIAEVAARAEEIVARNRIAHPGFVPGGEPLELLSDAR